MATWSQVKSQKDAKKNDLTGAMVGYGAGQPLREPDPSLYTTQAQMYQRLSWIYGAVSVVSNTAASLANLQVYRLDGETKSAIFNHPFEQLLRAPNPLQYTTRYEFLEALIGFLRLSGNAYIYVNALSPDAPPAEMWILRPDRVLVVPDKEKFVRGYVYEIDNQSVAFDADEIVHIKLFHPLNDFYGMSAIETLAIAAESDYAQAVWNRNFFGKDNAKPQGALAYADTYDDETWQQIKQDIRDEYGGTKRRVMMLRGVGAGGVQWLNMGVSQKDMEFLAGRKFSKEEIYSILAPGLSQMIDPNATMANSVSGEKTFREYALYTLLKRIDEVLTAKLMPRYGKGLVCEFDEIRIRDINLELAQRASYERTHTVDEVRAKFDSDNKGIGDERGKLMPSQITPPPPELPPGLGGAESPTQGQSVAGQSPATGTEGGQTVAATDADDDAGARLNREYAKGLDPRALDALKATERKQFKNFCKHAPGRVGEFKFAYLDVAERSQLLATVSGSSAGSVTTERDDAGDLRAQFAAALKQFEDVLDTQANERGEIDGDVDKPNADA